MHDDEIEPVVETKDSGKSLLYLPPRGRIQSPKIGGDHVKVKTVPLGEAGDVPAERCVGWTVRQKKGTGGQS
ncbi:MAG: hypothetical protein M3417_07920 [Actinomycetota bacterium]|nr:hypothetical protein [Actinomycetota bacterium]